MTITKWESLSKSEQRNRHSFQVGIEEEMLIQVEKIDEIERAAEKKEGWEAQGRGEGDAWGPGKKKRFP